MSGVTAATALTYAAVAAAAYGAYSTYQSGQQTKLNAEAQGDQAEADARTEKSAAVVQAERIRKMARIQAGQATAGLAAAGVDTGEGSAININEEIIGGGEEDAALTIFGGKNKAQRLDTDAGNYKMAGKQAASAATGQATASLISSGSQAYSGWKGAAKN